MAAESVERFIKLLKTNKPVAIMFGLSVLGLLIIFGFLMKELITLAIISSVPWCEIEKTKCGGQGYHIGCQPNHFPENPDCQNIKLVDMDKNLKRVILNKHNEIRDATASGFYDFNIQNKTNQLHFPTASRMREVVWDDQLQEGAELHAIKCNFEHDRCRSTEKYSYVGQNIAYQRSPRKNDDPVNVVTSLITDWYDERFTTNSKIFEKFLDELNNHNGHYLVMVNENVEKIGCAYIKYEISEKKKKKLYGHQLTCNYSYSNMLFSPVFKIGRPISDCDSIKSHTKSIFKYLCGPVADQ